jgi:acyl carrier protein
MKERGKMQNSINQRVIDFTAGHTGVSSGAIDNSTTLESLGIASEQDTIQYIMELEDNFGLPYDAGDEAGIVTVGDAAALIMNKLA